MTEPTKDTRARTSYLVIRADGTTVAGTVGDDLRSYPEIVAMMRGIADVGRLPEAEEER